MGGQKDKTEMNVYTVGTFDLLHVGHLALLNHCKSLGNILDPLDIIDKYGIDQLRYYLIKEVSLGNDGNVSMENLKNCINNDLANNSNNHIY